MLQNDKTYDSIDKLYHTSELSDNHYQDWKKSAVSDAIIAANVTSADGDRALELLLYSKELPRTNAGRLAGDRLNPNSKSNIWKKYGHVEHGGWWCASLDPLDDFEPMLWGCFKPDQPRIQKDKNKPIKYEHPPKTAARAFFLAIGLEEWQRISETSGVPMPPSIITHSGFISHLVSDTQEVGKAFWEWILANPEVPIVIVEGAKKAGCLLSHGYAAIGLPGVSQGFRKNGDTREVIPELEPFLEGERDIRMCFDSDNKRSTRKNVEKMLRITARTIAKVTSQVSIIELPLGLANKMGVDDYIITNGSDAFHFLFINAKNLHRWISQELYQLTYKPNIIINQKYIGDVEYPKSGLVCVKAPKGSGKTEKLKIVVRKAMDDLNPTIIITHRIQLGRAITERLGLDWIEDVKTSEQKGWTGYGLCIDSLHPKSQARFKPSNYHGCALVIDEVEQVILHLLNSSTCKKDRVAILRCLRELVNEVIEGDGLIVLQDADLSDLSIDFIRGLLNKDIEPWVLVNEYLPDADNCWDITYYNEGRNPNHLLKDCWKAIAQGQKLYIYTDTQKIKGNHAAQNIERAIKKKAPKGTKVLRIDSETVSDPSHAAYGVTEHLNEVIPEYDIVIATPTLGTGVSIDVRGHFDAVYAICKGTSSEPEIRQALARVRDPIPRYVWARKSGVSLVSNHSPFYWDISKTKIKEVERNILLLKSADMGRIDEPDFHPSYHTWAKAAARTNAGLLNLRESLLEGLKEEGHRVTIHKSGGEDDDAEAKIIGEEQKEIRDIARAEDDVEVASAEIISKEQAEKLESKRNLTKEERQSLKKYKLTQLYPGTAITPELKRADDEGWRSKIRLHYNLLAEISHVRMRDRRQLAAQIERGEGTVCLSDLRLQSARVEALKLLNIPEFLRERIEWTAESPQVLKLVEKCETYRQDIKTYLGIWMSDRMLEKPMQVVQALLGLLGIKLERRQETINGKKVRIYFYAEPEDCRWSVFKAWSQQDTDMALEAVQMEQPPLLANNSYRGGCSEALSPPNRCNAGAAGAEGGVVPQENELSPVDRLRELFEDAQFWRGENLLNWTTARIMFKNAEAAALQTNAFPFKDYWGQLVSLLFPQDLGNILWSLEEVVEKGSERAIDLYEKAESWAAEGVALPVEDFWERMAIAL